MGDRVVDALAGEAVVGAEVVVEGEAVAVAVAEAMSGQCISYAVFSPRATIVVMEIIANSFMAFELRTVSKRMRSH